MRGHPDRRAFGVGQRRPGNVDAPSASRSPRPMRYDLPELGFHSLSLCLAPELEVGTVLPGGAVVCQLQEIERLRLALAPLCPALGREGCALVESRNCNRGNRLQTQPRECARPPAAAAGQRQWESPVVASDLARPFGYLDPPNRRRAVRAFF